MQLFAYISIPRKTSHTSRMTHRTLVLRLQRLSDCAVMGCSFHQRSIAKTRHVPINTLHPFKCSTCTVSLWSSNSTSQSVSRCMSNGWLLQYSTQNQEYDVRLRQPNEATPDLQVTAPSCPAPHCAHAPRFTYPSTSPDTFTSLSPTLSANV